MAFYQKLRDHILNNFIENLPSGLAVLPSFGTLADIG
jgi:hypothetical protein